MNEGVNIRRATRLNMKHSRAKLTLMEAGSSIVRAKGKKVYVPELSVAVYAGDEQAAVTIEAEWSTKEIRLASSRIMTIQRTVGDAVCGLRASSYDSSGGSWQGKGCDTQEAREKVIRMHCLSSGEKYG